MKVEKCCPSPPEVFSLEFSEAICNEGIYAYSHNVGMCLVVVGEIGKTAGGRTVALYLYDDGIVTPAECPPAGCRFRRLPDAKLCAEVRR